jgi:hypothetical protein
MSYTPNQISETSLVGINSDTAISGGNWVTDTYTGTFELNDYAYVGVNLQVDEAGTLFFDFSQDGVNFSSYPVAGVDIASGINEVHTAWKGGRYFRVRFVGTGGRSFFRLKTFFSHHSLPLSAPLNQGIGNDQDATVVRSVGIGENPTGSFVNEKADGIAYSTQTNLTAFQTYTSGISDARGFTQLQTHINSSNDGTLEFIFYSDSAGTDTVRTLTIPYFSANGFEMFSAPCFSDYVEYKFTNDEGVTQTDFHYETKFLTKALSGQVLALKAPIVGGMVANVGRSVIVGEDPAGSYRNVPTDTEGHLKVNINDPITAFGDLRTAELNPQVQLTFPYGINSDIVDTTLANGGTVTQADSMAVLNTSIASNGSAIMSSRDVVNYRSGLGTLARFTSVFTAGVANSHQIIGIGDAEDGFFVGYNGTDFGILIRRGGVDTWTPQTAWNVDIMDGNDGTANPSNMLLDKTKINVFQIEFQWLGAGEIKFQIENPETGGFVPVHRVKYANNFVIPSIYNPNLTLSAEVSNDGNISDLELKTASMAGFTEGKNIVTGPINSFSGSFTGTAETHHFHIRNKGTYLTKTNKIRCILKSLSCGNDTTAISSFTVYRNATLAGTASWTDIDANDSVIEADTVQTYSSGGKVLFRGIVGREGGDTFDLESLGLKISPNDIITITSETEGNSALMVSSLLWQEDF